MLVFLCGCSHSPWSKKNTILEITQQSILLIDLNQTLQIIDDPRRYETNVVLGEHPSKDQVIGYFVLSGLIHAGISYVLPEPLRTGWQTSTIIVTLPCVIHNKFTIGLGIKF